MPIAQILTLISSILAAAPDVADAVTKIKTFISALFTSKLITAAQQDALRAHVDAQCALIESGISLPSHWLVAPDPA